MGSGRFTKEERSQPKVERKPGGNIRKERQPDLWWLLLFSHSRQEIINDRFTRKEKSPPKAKRQPEGNMNEGKAAQAYGDSTPSTQQTCQKIATNTAET